MSDDDAAEDAEAEEDLGPDRVSDGVVTIERDHACFRNLAWRVAIDRGGGARLRAALAGVMEDQTRDDRLVVMRSKEGHCVIVVPETGRVQLRLAYDSDQATRPEIALELAHLVTSAARTSGG